VFKLEDRRLGVFLDIQVKRRFFILILAHGTVGAEALALLERALGMAALLVAVTAFVVLRILSVLILVLVLRLLLTLARFLGRLSLLLDFNLGLLHYR